VSGTRTTPDGSRIPPHDLEAEQALLGAMLLTRDAIDAASGVASPDDFYDPGHGHVFEAVTGLYGRGEPVDPITVADDLRRRGLLEQVGGPGAIIALQAATLAVGNAGRYARIIEELARLRRLIAVGAEITELGWAVPEDVDATVDRAGTLVRGLAGQAAADEEEAEAVPADGPRLAPSLIEDHLLGWCAVEVSASTGISLAGPWAVLCSIVGTYIGPGPHIVTAGTRRAHDYVGLVGASGQGKGYTVTSVTDMLRPVLDMGEWLDERTATGVNSGEHLIDRLAEEGDCRLLHYEPEIGRLMAVDSRGGSTLSAVVRDAYDSPAVLKTGSRSKVARAESPHLGSIVACTPADLGELMTPQSLRNGVAGRYGWHHVRQDVYRPFGAAAADYDSVRGDLARVISDASRLGVLRWSPEATEMWAVESATIAAEVAAMPDPLDALLSRGPSECASLVLLLVVTDVTVKHPRHTVEARHVEAAVAIWRGWRVPSTLYVFGGAGLVEASKEAVREREADAPDLNPFARRANRVHEAAKAAGGTLGANGQDAALGKRSTAVERAAIRTYLERQGLGYSVEGSHARQRGQRVVYVVGSAP